MPQERIPLAVAGAHLRGQPLNHQLTDLGARLLRTTTTAAAYRMVRLRTTPAKPGVFRVGDGGAPIEVEVWDLDAEAHASFAAQVPAPLAIGPLELVDGTWVPGFVCDPDAAHDAEDITAFGSWRAWLAAPREAPDDPAPR